MSSKKVKIAIFPPKTGRDKVLSTNGIALDNICLKAETQESIVDGNYFIDCTFLIDDDGLWENIVEEAILKVSMDYGDEIFRINKPRVNRRDIEVTARQITISETMGLWLDNVRPTDQNGLGALNWILNNAVGDKEIFLQSDITEINTADYVRMNMYNAIHTSDNCFINKWGGEVQRRQYTLKINSRIGSDRGVTIRSGKNLTGFESTTNVDNLTTRVIGQGFNGLMGDYIDSPIIDKYAKVYTKVIEYPEIKVKTEDNPDGFETEAEAKAEINRRAMAEFTENRIDELRADYNINFVYLEKTEEYKDYVQLERVYLGDTITVIEDKLGVNLKVRALTRKYDVLRGMVKEITLSNTPVIEKKAPSISNLINRLKADMKGDATVSDYITSMMEAGLKDSFVITRKNELLVLDTPDINTATNVIRLNKNGLAFSQTGYYGKYEYGFTIDGVINASLISTGILSTILIQNADGSFQIDLSGTGGAKYFNNGKLAMEMKNNLLKFYSWFQDGDFIGDLGSFKNIETGKPVIALSNDIDSTLVLGYRTNDSQINEYMLFDKYGVRGEKVPIYMKEPFACPSGWRSHNDNTQLYLNDGSLVLWHNGKAIFSVSATSGVSAATTLSIPSTTKVSAVALTDQAKENITGTVYNIETGEVLYDSEATTTTTGEEIVAQARKLIGLPYKQDGTYNYLTNTIPPYVDCSSLCQWSYYQVGITISRTTYTQINEGTEVTESELQPGDLVFSYFSATNVPEHVFLYAGKDSNGNHTCIEAQTDGTYVLERTFTWTSEMRARRLI